MAHGDALHLIRYKASGRSVNQIVMTRHEAKVVEGRLGP